MLFLISLFNFSGPEKVEVEGAGVSAAAADVVDGAEGPIAASNTTSAAAGPEAGGQSSEMVTEQPLSIGYFKVRFTYCSFG